MSSIVINLFNSGVDGYHTYRIPSLLLSPGGALLAFCEGRRNSSDDHGDIDLVLKRSEYPQFAAVAGWRTACLLRGPQE